MTSFGKLFLSAMLAQGTVSNYLSYGPIEHLFNGSEAEVHEFFRSFVKQYGAMPSADTITNHTHVELPKAPEPPDYYLDLLKQRWLELELKRATKKIADHLLASNKDINAAADVMTQTVVDISTKTQQHKIMDMREAYPMVVGEYVQGFSIDDSLKMQMGWPTLDKMTGGVGRGDVVSLVGRPGLGKSFLLLYSAHYGWKKAEKMKETEKRIHSVSRLFVSMEMDRLSCAQRLAAIQAGVPMTQLKHSALSGDNFKLLKKGLVEIQDYGAPLWIVDGNLTSSVEDIHMLVRQLKPDAVFIDGAYLVTHPTERDRFRRVAENATLIKQEIASLAPTVCSWQFARPPKGSKKAATYDLDDIGYSDAIGQISSVALGMSQVQSVETVNRRQINIIKGRNGESGSFFTNFSFNNMDFSEYVEGSIEDLSFV